MVSDNLPRARKLLEEAVEKYEESNQKALPMYNLGIIEAKEGQLSSALDRFELAVKQIGDQEKRKRAVACLILPKRVDAKLVFEEAVHPDLLETAKSAIAIVKELLEKE
jgi:tetratricopeptide (TPR) repeat protein